MREYVIENKFSLQECRFFHEFLTEILKSHGVKLSGVAKRGEEGYVHDGRGRDVGREDGVVESAFNSRSVTSEAPRH